MNKNIESKKTEIIDKSNFSEDKKIPVKYKSSKN